MEDRGKYSISMSWGEHGEESPDVIGAFILSHGVVYLDRSAPIQVRMAWRCHKGMPDLFILAPTMNEHSYTSMGIYIYFLALLNVQDR